MNTNLGTTWPARLYETALAAGYAFSVPQIGKAIKPLVDTFGEKQVTEVWLYWVTNAVDMGSSQFMSPAHFARTYAHWRRMQEPAR